MNGDLAELLDAARTGGARNAEEILVDDDREKCIKVTEKCTVLARSTNSEASTIMRSVTGIRRRCEGSGLVEDVGSLGNVSEGCEGEDHDETG